MAKGLPLFPLQLVSRIKAFGKQHDELRRKLQEQKISAFSTAKKDAVVVVLKDRVEPGSEKRKLFPEISAGVLHVQANECGPFGHAGGNYAQIVCNEDGTEMSPLVDFRRLAAEGRGHVAPGGHVAIFDSATLITVKGYQDKQQVVISRNTPVVENDAAFIENDIIYLGNLGEPLPEEHARFAGAYTALLARLRNVNTVELMFGKK